MDFSILKVALLRYRDKNEVEASTHYFSRIRTIVEKKNTKLVIFDDPQIKMPPSQHTFAALKSNELLHPSAGASKPVL